MRQSKAKPQTTVNRPITRAAVYLRVSTEEQANNGYGLDVQRERCLAMAIVKGWHVEEVNIYRDEGISGTKGIDRRPGLAALVAAVEMGNVDAVIVLSLDRLARKAAITLDLVDRIVAAGAELVSCKESIDTTTPAGRFFVTVLAAMAQWERDNIVERTTAGRNQRGKIDGEKGGRLPYGYTRSAQGIDVDPRAAGVVRFVFSQHLAGASLREIAAELNRRNTAPPYGSIWHHTSVREVLLNESAYYGSTRGDSAVCWPAILQQV